MTPAGDRGQVPEDSCKFYWARGDTKRKECEADPTSDPNCVVRLEPKHSCHALVQTYTKFQPALQPLGVLQMNTSIKDGSFAQMIFKSKEEAEFEIISHQGEVSGPARPPPIHSTYLHNQSLAHRHQACAGMQTSNSQG